MTKSERDLLRRVLAALDDWVRLYAPEQCHEEHVLETRKRIVQGGGTLAYIARLRADVRAAMERGLPKAKDVKGILR